MPGSEFGPVSVRSGGAREDTAAGWVAGVDGAEAPGAMYPYAYRVLKRYGSGFRTESEVSEFLRWIEAEGLATSTRSTILSTIRRVQPGNQALAAVRVKVPSRSVQEEVLSKGEIKRVLEDLRVNEEWHYPIFSVWLGTGLRNSELIGQTWDCVRLEDGEVLISKTLRRDGSQPIRGCGVAPRQGNPGLCHCGKTWWCS